jgi:Xaa-Pro dipeptidase
MGGGVDVVCQWLHSSAMLAPHLSRQRQRRVLQVMQDQQLDAVVVGQPHHVYYLSTFLPGWQHQAALVLLADGQSVLINANNPAKNAAADDVRSYEANWMGTLRQEQPGTVAALVTQVLNEKIGSKRRKTIGVDNSAVTAHVVSQWFDSGVKFIDPYLWQIRRAKDADELELMRKAARCTEAMYRQAREIIEPGIPELEVFTQLNRAAVLEAGEPLTALLGNDYASGVGGGPARGNHQAQAGHVYVLDLGPCYRGYFADNCRAFAVDRKPTDAQMKAWHAVTGALKIVEQAAKPGAKGREIFKAVDEHLKAAGYAGMVHHLGHGVGLQPHEYPHLNLKWDDTLIEGEVFTAEPGLYGKEINGGIRLENQYLVTANGVTNLLDFPLELA